MAIVTYENVVAAAEALVADGQKPSVRSVIKQLGGGSPNAVLKLLNEYKAGRPVIRSSDIELDPSIIAAMVRQMRTVAETATADAEERLSSLSDDLATMAESNQSLEQRVEQLANDLTAAHQQIEHLTSAQHDQQLKFAGDLDAMKAKNAELAADLDKERERANGAQQELGKAQAKAEAVPILESLVAKLQEELKAEGAARAAAEQRAAVADAQRVAAEQSAAEAKASARDVRDAAEKADQGHKEFIAQARRDIEDSRAELREAAQELKASRDALEDARNIARQARAEAESAKAIADALRKQIANNQTPEA